MAQKQGGKGKKSSPSDIGYWKRVNPEAQRAKRIERHARKLLKHGGYENTPNALKAAINHAETNPQDFPKTHRSKPFSPDRVILSDRIPDFRKAHELGHPIFSLVCNGRILQQSLNESECLLARPYSSRLDYQVIRQKSGGFRDVRSFRAFN